MSRRYRTEEADDARTLGGADASQPCDRADLPSRAEDFELSRFDRSFTTCAHLRSLIAESTELEQRVAGLRRAIHSRAGLEDRPVGARPTDRRAEAESDGERLVRLREEVGQGSRRVAAIEARVAKLGHQLRSGELGWGSALSAARGGRRD